MAEIQNRTLICTVLFIDIVEYSRKPVVEQLHLKDRFNELLKDALREVAQKDRIVIDTGDGAACTFTGDPEDALFVATRLQEGIARDAEADMSQLAARMGINLGPVRLVKDINGQPNVIGDGINVSQRIMNFAQPGEVLVSHAYYDAVSRLSGESSSLFIYKGSRTDKHIRDHEVYSLCLTAAAQQKRSNDERRAQHARELQAATTVFDRAALFCERVREVFRAKPHWSFSLGLIVAVLFSVAFRVYEKDLVPQVVAETMALPGPVPLQPTVTIAKLEQATPKNDATTVVDAAPAAPAASADAAPAPAQAAIQQETTPVERKETPTRAEPKKAPVDTAMVDLAIAPWGTVYVDGKERGASPPLRELKLKEGKHRIEVKNGGFPDHVVMVNVKPGERVTIKHKFRQTP